MKYREAQHQLVRAGYALQSIRGSHIVFAKSGRTIMVVRRHGGKDRLADRDIAKVRHATECKK